ncbi:MAG: hypothetical protein KGI27_09600 [Thaumarchaeota archaeon]|nr:hypothetical protein [Nitrososphaerota archaeon]
MKPILVGMVWGCPVNSCTDYNITISQGGKTVFNQKFHTYNGNLAIVFTPSAGQVSMTGGLRFGKH